MAVHYSISQVANIVTDKAQDVTEEIVEAGRKFYCNLHQNHPAWTVARRVGDYSIILRAIDQMCSDGDYISPPVPESEFTGGQCEGVQYDVSLRLKFASNTNAGNNRDDTTTFRVVGPVDGFVLSQGGVFPSSANSQFGPGNVISFGVELFSNGRSVAFLGQAFAKAGGSTPQTSPNIIEITGITRVDGAPDDCGNPPVNFPTEPPPSDNDLQGDITIINNNNESNTYNVTVNRDDGDTINFPGVLNINNIGVGIDITGISVGVVNNSSRSGGGGGANTFEKTQEKEPDIIEKDPEELEEETEVTVEEKLVAIIVKVTSKPGNAKISSGNGAPDIIYAGWIEFKIKDNYFPRVFIDFESNYFPAPDDADGYAVTMKVGYTATVQKVVEETP